jgi:hypothetical protein
MFADPRTTIVGLVAAVVILVKAVFGIEVPTGVSEGFIAVVVFLLGLFSRDSGGVK